MALHKRPAAPPVTAARVAAGLFAAVALATTLPLSGCGSGAGSLPVVRNANGGGTNVDARRGRATIAVRWPERTRVIPVAAESIVVRLTRVDPGPTIGPAPTVTLTRPAPGDDLVTVYEFTDLEIGKYVADVKAYPNADGTGVVQAGGPNGGALGTATAPVDVVDGDNTPLTIRLDATVRSVTIAPDFPVQLRVGQTQQYIATAFDGPNGTGNVVLVTGAIEWTSSNPAAVSVNATGVATGVALGNATITATYKEPSVPVGTDGTGASASTFVTTVAIGVDPNAPWGRFRGDLQNTGQAGSNVTGNATAGNIEAERAIGGGAIYFSSPAIAADGTVFIGTVDNGGGGTLYALKQNGGTFDVVWFFKTGGAIESSPTIGANGIVYVGSFDGKVYALPVNPADPANPVPLWTFQTDGAVHGSPVIDARGILYVGGGTAAGRTDNKLYALDSLSGRLEWTFNPDRPGGMDSSPALSRDQSTVFIGSRDGNLYAVPTTGTGATRTARWSYPTGAGSEIAQSSPAVALLGGSETVFIGSTSGEVHAVNATTGAAVWTKGLGATLLSSPALVTDAAGEASALYIGTFDLSGTDVSRLFKLDATNGDEIWQFPDPVGLGIGPITSSPTIGRDGAVYFGSGDGGVYAVNADGSLRFRVDTPNNPAPPAASNFVDSTPGIGADGTIYIGITDANGASGSVLAIR